MCAKHTYTHNRKRRRCAGVAVADATCGMECRGSRDPGRSGVGRERRWQQCARSLENVLGFRPGEVLYRSGVPFVSDSIS